MSPTRSTRRRVLQGIGAGGTAAILGGTPLVAAQEEEPDDESDEDDESETEADTGEDEFAAVRFGHLSPDAPDVDVYLAKSPDLNPTLGALQYPTLGPGPNDGYLQVPPGTYDVVVTPEGTTDAAIEVEEVELESGVRYSALAIGALAAADDTAAEDDAAAEDDDTAADENGPDDAETDDEDMGDGDDGEMSEREQAIEALSEEADYVFDGITAGWEGLYPESIEGEQNPTIELNAGETYVFGWINADGAPHNIAIWDADGNQLEATEIIDETDATQTLEFEATAEMAEYICEVHPAQMVGDLSVQEDQTDTAGDETAETLALDGAGLQDTGLQPLVIADADSSDEATPPEGEAEISFVHASPDAGPVDVTVDGESLLEDVEFGDASDYFAVEPGEHEAGIVAGGEEVLTETRTLRAGTSITAYVTGFAAEATPEQADDTDGEDDEANGGDTETNGEMEDAQDDTAGLRVVTSLDGTNPLADDVVTR